MKNTAAMKLNFIHLNILGRKKKRNVNKNNYNRFRFVLFHLQ